MSSVIFEQSGTEESLGEGRVELGRSVARRGVVKRSSRKGVFVPGQCGV